jgi:hypothetical protein
MLLARQERLSTPSFGHVDELRSWFISLRFRKMTAFARSAKFRAKGGGEGGEDLEGVLPGLQDSPIRS